MIINKISQASIEGSTGVTSLGSAWLFLCQKKGVKVDSETTGLLIIQGLAYGLIIFWHERRAKMSRFGSQCKRCRCFRENITSEEIKEIMVHQNLLCFAAEDPYASGKCKLFLDIEEPIEELVKVTLRESEKS